MATKKSQKSVTKSAPKSVPQKKLVVDNNNRISVENAVPAREMPSRPEASRPGPERDSQAG